MDHPRRPTLLLSHVLFLHHIWTLSPYLFHVFHPRTANGVRLILDQYMTQVQDTIHISRRLDHGFVLEHARDDAVRDGASCGKELLGEKWDVTGNGK